MIATQTLLVYFDWNNAFMHQRTQGNADPRQQASGIRKQVVKRDGMLLSERKKMSRVVMYVLSVIRWSGGIHPKEGQRSRAKVKGRLLADRS